MTSVALVLAMVSLYSRVVHKQFWTGMVPVQILKIPSAPVQKCSDRTNTQSAQTFLKTIFDYNPPNGLCYQLIMQQ